MSLLNEIVDGLKISVSLDEILSDLDSTTVEEQERILREYFESGWKDEAREHLRPWAEACERGEVTEDMFKAIAIADVVSQLARNRIVQYYLLKEIRRLKGKDGT
jgi:hypothetical protein